MKLKQTASLVLGLFCVLSAQAGWHVNVDSVVQLTYTTKSLGPANIFTRAQPVSFSTGAGRTSPLDVSTSARAADYSSSVFDEEDLSGYIGKSGLSLYPYANVNNANAGATVIAKDVEPTSTPGSLLHSAAYVRVTESGAAAAQVGATALSDFNRAFTLAPKTSVTFVFDYSSLFRTDNGMVFENVGMRAYALSTAKFEVASWSATGGYSWATVRENSNSNLFDGTDIAQMSTMLSFADRFEYTISNAGSTYLKGAVNVQNTGDLFLSKWSNASVGAAALAPVPEPSTYVLLLAGLALFSLKRRVLQ